jgi:4-aminobutyrate aminotransferase
MCPCATHPGIGTTSTGHCHPRVVEAVRAQAGHIVHAQQNIFAAHGPMVQLLEQLEGIMPPHLTTFFFCNSE